MKIKLKVVKQDVSIAKSYVISIFLCFSFNVAKFKPS